MTTTPQPSEGEIAVRDRARKLLLDLFSDADWDLLDLFSEADWDDITIVAHALDAVRADGAAAGAERERERCARIVEHYCKMGHATKSCVDDIRARGEAKP